MKLIEMKNIAETRENLIGFLHFSEIQAITNRKASLVFDILANANKQFKTERYRYNSATHEIYEYSQANEAYIFIKKGNQSELKNLIAENGKYI